MSYLNLESVVEAVPQALSKTMFMFALLVHLILRNVSCLDHLCGVGVTSPHTTHLLAELHFLRCSS